MTQEVRVAVDTGALRHNVEVLRRVVHPARVMTVVKANAYGHGAVESARAFEEAGVDWIGVVDLDEAVALRRAGISVPILAWLHAPGETFQRAVQFDVTPAISDLAQLGACARAGVPVVHLCLDTGLSRNGAVESEWAEFFDRARSLRGAVEVGGVMSHLSNTSPAEDAHQLAAFLRGVRMLADRGITAPLQHIAASASGQSSSDARLGMVRFGLSAYGLSPLAGRTPADLGLRPALTLTAPVIGLKRVLAGEGTSYGLTWRAERDTRLALLPVGYADGIERIAGNRARVLLGGRLRPVVGRIAMNALTVDLGPDDPTDAVALGDEAVLFGDAEKGHPTVADWAEATGTIDYEVVARLSARLPRSYR
ncbi:Alanine racemase [Frondihabitans sp. 762G35]|uniref:alanine racemase n=1 Tax=Frondihabitans sp. 762G35 TaxID=1446794 RepID=UPI000D220A74|nr:alanine racemase [Frondihabitans sp. 762G35]ARC55786.1 Alanine racemase [Frondihabitans sp. 762G35]